MVTFAKLPPSGILLVDVQSAHSHSAHHRDVLRGPCGCFHCLAIFDPAGITEWTDDDTTAFCPSCGIDSVIGSESGYPITAEFLSRMRTHWMVEDEDTE